jgi:MoaA/NifB/PqqE/SkfB family radical SAM enzyme
MYDSRLVLIERDRLDQRFAAGEWRKSRKEIALDVLLPQLDEIDPEHCRRLVLSGSNPLEHTGFIEMVESCKTAKIPALALEGPALALANEHVVGYLEQNGFKEVFLVACGLDSAIHDSVMADEGSHEAYLEGLKRAAQSSLKTYVVIPVIRSTVDGDVIKPFLKWLLKVPGKIQGVLFSMPRLDQVPEDAWDEVLPYNELAVRIPELFKAAKNARLEFGLHDKKGVSPCGTSGELDGYGTVFQDRINFLKRTAVEGITRIEVCKTCVLAQNCPGIEREYVQHFGEEGLRAIGLDEALAWRLRPLNRLEQWDYKQISDFDNPVTNREMSLVRINGHCNMACSFCFVDRAEGDHAVDPLIEKIKDFADEGSTHLIVSGGEPTIHPNLPQIIRAAKNMGFTTIEMQSNGVKSAEMNYARSLADAGLTMVTFSLHSIDPAKSDEITRLPNAFGKTVQAIHNFRELGILTQMACVITKSNYEELPEYVRFIREEFPEDGGHMSICFAMVQGISDLVADWVVPRFTEIKPYFRNALDYCLDTSLGFGGIIGQGGYPPCMLDGDYKYHARLSKKIYRSPEHQENFYKSESCKECTFNPYCVGVRATYVDMYGDSEIQPISDPITFLE